MAFKLFKSAVNLFFLREQSFEAFAFPRWQSAIVIGLVGLLLGLDPSMRFDLEREWASLGVSLGLALLSSALACWGVMTMLRWWMKRGGRWDGQGSLFNLVAASWLVVDGLDWGLAALGVPPIMLMPLWLYSFWVGASALAGAIPKASLSYALVGVGLSVLYALLIYSLVLGLAAYALVLGGLMHPEQWG